MVWDPLLDYGRIGWQRTTLHDLGKALDVVAYKDVLHEFDSVRSVKRFIVSRSNLSITWKIRPRMAIVS